MVDDVLALEVELLAHHLLLPMRHHLYQDVVLEESDLLHLLVLLNLLPELLYAVEHTLLLFVARDAPQRHCQVLFPIPLFIINNVIRIRQLPPIHIAKLLAQFFIVLNHLQVLEQLLLILLSPPLLHSQFNTLGLDCLL